MATNHVGLKNTPSQHVFDHIKCMATRVCQINMYGKNVHPVNMHSKNVHQINMHGNL